MESLCSPILKSISVIRMYLFAHILNTRTFQLLRDFNLRDICSKKDVEEIGKVPRSRNKNTCGKRRCEMVEASTYFLDMTRMEVLKWTFGGLKSMMSCCQFCRTNDRDSKTYQRIHHRLRLFHIEHILDHFGRIAFVTLHYNQELLRLFGGPRL